MTSVTRLSLEEGSECLAPTSIGVPQLKGFLWVRQKGVTGWKRRFVVQKANFIYWFAEKDAAQPVKPLGVLCFEDLVVEPLEPPPTEKDVLAFSGYGFSVQTELQASLGTKTKAGERRNVAFVAEGMEDMNAWMKALLVWRYELLAEDRNHLSRTRDDLASDAASHARLAALRLASGRGPSFCARYPEAGP